MSLRFALEQLQAAVDALAVSPTSMAGRVADAFVDHLAVLDPDKDLPGELRDRYRRLAHQLTRFGESHVGARAAATIADSVALAREMVATRQELARHSRRR
jgi:hypothetical protein